MDTFWCHVIGCTYIVLKRNSALQSIPRALNIRTGKIFSCAKVNQLDLVALVEEDVFRLKVPVDNMIFFMKNLDSFENMSHVVTIQRLPNYTKMLSLLP